MSDYIPTPEEWFINNVLEPITRTFTDNTRPPPLADQDSRHKRELFNVMRKACDRGKYTHRHVKYGPKARNVIFRAAGGSESRGGYDLTQDQRDWVLKSIYDTLYGSEDHYMNDNFLYYYVHEGREHAHMTAYGELLGALKDIAPVGYPEPILNAYQMRLYALSQTPVRPDVIITSDANCREFEIRTDREPSQPIQSTITKVNTMNYEEIKATQGVETRTFVYGQPADNMSDDDIFGHITQLEMKIDRYDEMKHKPVAVKKRIENLKGQIDALVKFANDRTEKAELKDVQGNPADD